jgi:hypothetical protein
MQSRSRFRSQTHADRTHERPAPDSVSSARELELLDANARYYRERIALLRAKQYGRGLGSSAQLQRLERELELAEQRLREAHQKRPAPRDSTTEVVAHEEQTAEGTGRR